MKQKGSACPKRFDFEQHTAESDGALEGDEHGGLQAIRNWNQCNDVQTPGRCAEV